MDRRPSCPISSSSTWSAYPFNYSTSKAGWLLLLSRIPQPQTERGMPIPITREKTQERSSKRTLPFLFGRLIPKRSMTSFTFILVFDHDSSACKRITHSRPILIRNGWNGFDLLVLWKSLDCTLRERVRKEVRISSGILFARSWGVWTRMMERSRRGPSSR